MSKGKKKERKAPEPLPQIEEIQITIKTVKEPNWDDAEGAWMQSLLMLLAAAEANAWGCRQKYSNDLVKDYQAKPAVVDRRRPLKAVED